MDLVLSCLTDIEAQSRSNNIALESELISETSAVTNKCESSCVNNIIGKEKNRKNLENVLSNSDDSFNIFMPIKKKAEKNTTDNKIGKEKVKKNKNRACPYFPNTSAKNYFKSLNKSKEDKDLELAIARSLIDVSGSGEISSNPSTEQEDKFPLIVKKELKLKNWTGKNSKKRSKSVLLHRTVEDRERIITQKLAIVLLEAKNGLNCNEINNHRIVLLSSILQENLNKNSTLWELSKKENTELTQFYVTALINFIEPINSTTSNHNMDLVAKQEKIQSSVPESLHCS